MIEASGPDVVINSTCPASYVVAVDINANVTFHGIAFHRPGAGGGYFGEVSPVRNLMTTIIEFDCCGDFGRSRPPVFSCLLPPPPLPPFYFAVKRCTDWVVVSARLSA